MILASVTTRNFDFTCLADTVENADRLLLAGWKVHRIGYPDADPNLMQGWINSGEVNYVHGVQPGVVLRDGEPLNLNPYVQGTYAQRNTGEACWSCAGLLTGAPFVDCIYPENHALERTP